ncbi:MAG: DUF1501 domain-containing protein [Pseudomonadota bacterium]
MSLSRRHFLRNGTALALGGATGFANDLMRFNAFAADTSGYKAVVCVFLFGGMDGHDALIPYDQSSYNQYASVRSELLNRYGDNEGGSTRTRDQLLPLNLANAGDFGGRQFALAPELGPLHELIERGDGALVGNVGPLVTPLDREDYRNRSAPRPPRLFSHNDQQSVWMSSEPEGARFGWGGRLADMIAASVGSADSTFSAVSANGNAVFLQGQNVGQYQVGSSGPEEIRGLGDERYFGADSFAAQYESLLTGEGQSFGNILQQDFTAIMDRSIEANRTLRESFSGSSPFSTVFPNSRLGRQMQVIARIIALRGTLGVSRQIFFAGTGGFDTHSNQAGSMPGLQANFAGAMRAFYDAMAEIGVDRDVVAFTASDFGRTLTINRDGTDHGWGGHHFVIGGGVNGSRIVGDVPEPVTEHSQDSGNGRLIPTTAVDQFAATLGRWYGLNESELDDALPGLSNFSQRDIGLF